MAEIHEEGFEDSNYTDVFTTRFRPNDELTGSPTLSGNRSLKVYFPEGSQDGTTNGVDLTDAGLVSSPIREMWARFHVYVPFDFELYTSAVKLPGPGNYQEEWVGGNGDGHGGDPAVGNGWSARIQCRNFSDTEYTIGSYVYHMDMDRRYGDNWAETWVPKGEWVEVTQHVKLNSVSGGNANRDGVLEQWLNGEKATDRHSLRFTDYPWRDGVEYQFDVWHGGSAPVQKYQELYIDDWVLSTDPIQNVDYTPASEATTGGVENLTVRPE